MKTQICESESLDAVPVGWKAAKLKYHAELNPKCKTQVTEDSEVTFTPMENIKNGYFIPGKEKYGMFAGNSQYAEYEEGDIAFAKVTPCFENDNIAIMQDLVNGKGFGSSELFVMRPLDIGIKYLFYLIQSPHFKANGVASMTGTGGLKRVSSDAVRNYKFALPGAKIQNLISSYLDTKCAEIDKVVEQTRATIEEYKKLKQAIITEAVTKGVRGPRPMKPSGVEWIGDIPGEWSLTKLKYNSILSPKSSPSGLVAEDCVTFTPMENIKNGFYIPNDAAFGRFVCNFQYSEYEENDIVFAKVTPCFENDNIAIMSNLTNGRGFGSSELFVVRALNIELRYLYYVLRTSFFKSKGIESMTGTGGLKRVSSGVVRNYNFAIPPKDEQQEIATYLDTKCAEIDLIIEKKEQLIEELGSYKKSLIYEYVTGKKEVTA